MENRTYVEVEGDRLAIGVDFSKVDIPSRTVEGFATLDNVDKTGEIVDFKASQEAFKSWLGNIREMHSPLAVGKAVSVEERDKGEHKGMYVRAYISKGAEDTWQKILDGTLKGFSIGGKVFEKRPEVIKSDDRYGRRQAYRITKYMLGELSVVDNPANPLALFDDITKFETLVKYEGDELHLTSIVTPDARNIFYCRDCDLSKVTSNLLAECSICDKNMMNVAVTYEDVTVEKVQKMVQEYITRSEGEEMEIENVSKATFAVQTEANHVPRTDPVTSTEMVDTDSLKGQVSSSSPVNKAEEIVIETPDDLAEAIESYIDTEDDNIIDLLRESAVALKATSMIPKKWKKEDEAADGDLHSNDINDNSDVNKLLQVIVDTLSKRLEDENLAEAQGGEFEKVDTQALNSILDVLKSAFGNVEEIIKKASVVSLNSETAGDVTLSDPASLPDGADAAGAVPGKVPVTGTGAQMDSWDTPPTDANVLPKITKSEDETEDVVTEDIAKAEDTEDNKNEKVEDLIKSITDLSSKTVEALDMISERVERLENSGASRKSGEIAEDLAKSAKEGSFWGGHFGTKGQS